MNTESISTFVRSKMFAGIVTGIGIMFILIVVFEAGVAVGYHEAMFSSHWGQNYSQNFGGPGFYLSGGPGPDADGTFGKVISISSSTLVIASNQKPEQKIIVDADTIIRDHENSIGTSSLSVGDLVVVLGDPNEQGEIDAKLIRIVPTPPMIIKGSAPSP